MNNIQEKETSLKGIVALTVCATIWGSAFVGQAIGAKYADPLTFNWARSVLATIFLVALSYIIDIYNGRNFKILGTKDAKKKSQLIKGGVLSGLMLTSASFWQQLGIMQTSVGKAGFITALYIVLVPLFAYFIFKRKITKLQIFSVGLAMLAMYFISITEEFSIALGDFYVLLCAFFFAFMILSVDYYGTGVDGIRLSMVMFATCTVLNAILMFIFETPNFSLLIEGWAPILYVGVMSSGVAYTLQIIGQQYCSSLLACMLMSLESVFALIFGWLILGQVMSTREIFGCTLLMVAILLAQLPSKNTGRF